jgi:hypothetical protein
LTKDYLPKMLSLRSPFYQDTHFSFPERAADLVSRMTLSEKVLHVFAIGEDAASLGRPHTYTGPGR